MSYQISEITRQGHNIYGTEQLCEYSISELCQICKLALSVYPVHCQDSGMILQVVSITFAKNASQYTLSTKSLKEWLRMHWWPFQVSVAGRKNTAIL
jgi:hypothetical protein